jgi:hypothetical protein
MSISKLHNLKLSLCMNLQDLGELCYLMEEMTKLPYIKFLTLHLTAKGHSFGASSFHVLRMCTSIRKLMLIFSSPLDLEVKLSLICLSSA